MKQIRRRGIATALNALTFSALVGTVTPSFAAGIDGGYSVHGAGLMPCKLFVQARKARDDAYYNLAGWLDGYITARNQFQPDTYDATSFESTPLLLAIIDQHCRKKPKQLFFVVVNSLLTELSHNRIEKKSPLVRVEVAGRSALYYQAVLQRMQTRLKRLGYYHGAQQAGFGEGLRKALAAYQKAHGLPADGFPDQPTLLTLFTDEGRGAGAD